MTTPESKPGPVIEMQDLSFGSMQDPRSSVAEHIDWTVNAGDYWIVAGLQGSGKSDFLMVTGGVMSPLAGSYRLFGEQMPIFEDARLHTRLRLGLVFADGQLLNNLTVRKNVALPLRYHRNLGKAEAEPAVNALLEAMELAPWADSTPGALSRNWQQRAGLARAVMLQPEVLLVDNPLGGLDLRHTGWWLGFLEQLSKGHPLLGGQPITLVVTTADLRPWKSRGQQFAILRNRQFSVFGTLAQLEAANEQLLQELFE